MENVCVRLIRKLAETIDGIDLSGRSLGDTFPVPPTDARLLIAERWAVRVEADDEPRATADDRPSRPRRVEG